MKPFIQLLAAVLQIVLSLWGYGGSPPCQPDPRNVPVLAARESLARLHPLRPGGSPGGGLSLLTNEQGSLTRGTVHAEPYPFMRAIKSMVFGNLVHSGSQYTMTSPTTPQAEKIRLTITVTPEVHETFSRMAAASSMSLGRTMGEWLGDTLDAAETMTELMENARKAPKQVMRQMHSYTLGLTDITADLLSRMRETDGRPQSAQAGAAPAKADPAPTPRPVIRGGKSPKDTSGARGKKS